MERNLKLMSTIRRMNFAFINRLSKNLESLGTTVSEFKMMEYLMNVSKAKTQKLGEVSMITSGTITHSINKLIKKGYVKKTQDEDDKRIFWIEITETGREAFTQIHEQHTMFASDLLSVFKEDEKDALIEMIEYFIQGVENRESHLEEE